MSAPKVHLYARVQKGGWMEGWVSHCGRRLPHGTKVGRDPEDDLNEGEIHGDCLDCLRAYASHHRWQAERSVRAGNAAQDRIDKQVRAQGRRKRRAQR